MLGLKPSPVLMGMEKVVGTGKRARWTRGAAHVAVLFRGVTSHSVVQPMVRSQGTTPKLMICIRTWERLYLLLQTLKANSRGCSF